jgi:uncharacterized protein YfbU (UPF0304 family)
MYYMLTEIIRKRYGIQVNHLDLRTFNILKAKVSESVLILFSYETQEERIKVLKDLTNIFNPRTKLDNMRYSQLNRRVKNIYRIMSLNQKFFKKTGIFIDLNFNKNTHGNEIKKLCRSIIIETCSNSFRDVPKYQQFGNEVCRIVSAKEISL